VSELSPGDQFLLDGIRESDPEVWSQFVQRYEGRLLAFAQRQSGQRADAEDLVQETFFSFLQGLKRYRGEASLETYLFTILRRRLIDQHRRAAVRPCRLDAVAAPNDDAGRTAQVDAQEPTPSFYARQDEQAERLRATLAEALRRLLDEIKRSERLEELKIAEALFYAQLRNRDAAELIGVDAGRVGLLKHRWVKQVGEQVRGQLRRSAEVASGTGGVEVDDLPPLLTEVWETHRLSCPKRSTVGRYLLDTLEPEWADYVKFHVERLGCRFCRANLDDLEAESAAREQRDRLHEQVMQSTIGFFRR